MIKTFIFDLGGVYFSNGTRSVCEKYSQQFNILHAKTAEVLNGPLAVSYRKGLLSEDRFWQEAQTLFGTSLDAGILREAWFSEYVPLQGTVDLIRNLRSQGYETLYLSNNVAERVTYLEKRYRFLRYFDSGIFSYQVAMVKPDIRIYQRVLLCTRSKPSECFFIDDKNEFLEPARRLGMSVSVFRSPSQIAQKMKDWNILVPMDADPSP